MSLLALILIIVLIIVLLGGGYGFRARIGNSLGRHVFHHRLACRLAFAAVFRTRLHVLVVRKLLALLCAGTTYFGAGRADGIGEWSAPCHDLGGSGTYRRTV
jgi:hypothetical protein